MGLFDKVLDEYNKSSDRTRTNVVNYFSPTDTAREQNEDWAAYHEGVEAGQMKFIEDWAGQEYYTRPKNRTSVETQMQDGYTYQENRDETSSMNGDGSNWMNMLLPMMMIMMMFTTMGKSNTTEVIKT
jgi:hypothetical protein